MRTRVLSDRRSMALIGLAAGAGVGALAWMMLDAGAADRQRLQDDQARLASARPALAAASGLGSPLASAIAHPLFALTTGPGALPEPKIVVSGLSRTAVRRAALISVDGGPADWMTIGQSVGAVTLEDVLPPKAVVETPFGRRDVYLGEGAPSSVPATAKTDASTLGNRPQPVFPSTPAKP